MTTHRMLSPFHPIQLILGFIVWACYFVGVYALLSIACVNFAPSPGDSPVNWLNLTLLAITFTVAATLLYQAWRGWKIKTPPAAPRFVNRIGVAVYLVAALATLGTGIPALVLIPCI